VKTKEERGSRFKGFDSEVYPRKGIMDFGSGMEIPVYIRTTENYNSIAQKIGFVKVAEEYPLFTREFISKYSSEFFTDLPEFLVLTYRK
jgi:hypothetical protein